MTVDLSNLRLGRVPAPRDLRNLRLAAYIPPDLPPPPRRVDYLSRVAEWPMYRNDAIGDCEVCACAHAEQSLSLYGAGREVAVAEPDVVAAYSALTGYNPATGQPDPGIRSLDMLGYWRTTGIGGRKITAYVEVDVDNINQVKTALHLAGALLVGIDMPLSAGHQFVRHQTWTAARGPRAKAGSWGGHAVHCGQFDGRGITCTTWGRTQRMTWGFWNAYVAEAFAPISLDWLTAAGTTPTGLNLDALLADLHRITSH